MVAGNSADNQGLCRIVLLPSFVLYTRLGFPSCLFLLYISRLVATADMRFFGVANAASLLALAGIGFAQFPPTPEGVTVRDSKFGDGVQLSWKEVCFP